MNNNISNSELSRLIPPEIKNDEFYIAIQRISKEEDIKTVLEIGSSTGEGSTEAFVNGLRQNPNQPKLFCMEVSQPRFMALKNRYANDSFIECYNASSVPIKYFPDDSEVIEFYNNNKTNLNIYSLAQVIGWLQQDIEYVKQSGVETEGIAKIKQENNIDFFDMVLIDGSEFTGSAELDEVYGAKYVLLDDINTFKNYKNLNRLLNDSEYLLIEHNPRIRNGYAIFKKKSVQLGSYKTVHNMVESIEGFMVPGQEEYLFNKVKSLPEDAVIVEIGSYKGRSTVAMAYACMGTERKIYSIDTWDGNDSDFPDRNFFDIWQQNVQKNCVEQYVLPIRGYSHDVLSRWHELANGKNIDFIFIDGSHQYLDVLKDFEMSFPLVKNSGWIAFHDVIHTWPGPELVWHNIAKHSLENHEYSSTLACGQKPFTGIVSTSIPELPIHFFTIVLNGQPFIRYHIEVFKQLPFKWHWHIVEGVADLKHDTAWSLQGGGRITDEIHQNGRSHDGTTEYLEEIARLYPNNITIYRKPEGIFWDGKLEMVNAPLSNIREECLLWQVDTDELWTVENLCSCRQLFINNPEKTAAFYWCWYFVGENLIISSRNCYAQNPQLEWLRTWRFKPGAVWAAHEPPILVESISNNQWINVADINPFIHEETEKLDLIFQHFAYATEAQLQFKEQYYGYSNAVSGWLKLQAETNFPVMLRQYFPWVKDETLVDTVNSIGIVPIAKRENDNNWLFLQLEEVCKQPAKINKKSPIIVVDAIFFQFYQTGIARVWKSLLLEWVKNGFARHIIVLDRAGTAPKITGIRYRSISPYDYSNSSVDREMLQQVCDEEGAELFISTYYTTPVTTPSVFMAHDMIPELMGWDLNHPMWREKHYGIGHAAAYIAVSENTARDLVKCFSGIPSESVKVANNGVDHATFLVVGQEDINRFKAKYGISKPYFILVGAGSGYKNSILFFQAFSQLTNSNAFDIVCTGWGGLLAEELRTYTLGSTIHMLQLSDEELATAYSGAISLIYPSKYEGFGLPVLEAIACGCPVITCANASIPEVAGKAALYVNDNDANDLADALCEVQKPSIRKSLIASGLEQAKQFSWSKMAKTVSDILINATLLSLNLKEINLIIFPDWSQPEELLSLDLEQVLRALATHHDRNRITLLINISNTITEDAELLLYGVNMNLLMQEDLDMSEELTISLVGDVTEIQWEVILPRIQSRIILEFNNETDVSQVKAETIPACKIDVFLNDKL